MQEGGAAVTSPVTVPERAEVVVIGGGVMGVSTAFHLAEAGVTDVVLLEQGSLGSGSTCRAAGGVRANFSDAVNIELGKRSLRAFEEFGIRPGQEIDLRRPGYLFLLSTEADVAAFEASVALQNELGVPSRMITVEEAVALSPLVRPDGLLAAAFSPTDGHCTPESVVLGYASGARRLGARVLPNCAVTGIDVTDGTVTAVRTASGTVATGTVVCTAGAWSGKIGAMAGVDLPVQPLRRQILVTGDVPDLPAEMPIATGWAGLYEVTPDHNAIIGETGTPSRFLYATGFSGHGFLMGPAIGEVLRDLYLGRQPFVDVSGFSADRFTGGTGLRPEANIV
jgi:sarcosine oxidase subunit beta